MKVVSDSNSFYKLTGEYELIEKANEFFIILGARNLSIHTIRSYAYDLLILFRWLLLKNKKFLKFNQKDLQDWLVDQKQNLEPRTINRRLVTCRIFYLFCYGRYIPHVNGVNYPAAYYKGYPRRMGIYKIYKKPHLELKVKVPRKIVEPLRPQIIDSILDNTDRFRDLAITLIMLLCGLRAQEVISLKVSDIDYNQGQIKVFGKGKKERMVPVPYQLMEAIQRYIAYERPESGNEHLFLVLQGKRRGQILKYEGLRNLFRYKTIKLELKKVTAHQFRHSFASDMVRAGVSLPSLQKLLGHADLQTTEIYAHLFMEDILKEYFKAMERIGSRYASLQEQSST